MKSPKHLWTGDWRSRRDEEAPTVAPLRPPPVLPEPEPEPRRRRRGPAIVAAIFGVLVLTAAAFVAGGLLQGEDPQPLPESRQGNLRPRSGQTRIGAIYASASPAVVSVRTNSGTGTGFLVDRQGTLVTNAHVDRRVGRRRRALRAQRSQHRRPGARHRPVLRPGRAEDLAAATRPTSSRWASRTPAACGSATARWPSATRSGWTGRPRRGSSPACAARSARPTASRSTRSSRPTRRSTPATRAARCSTTPRA